MSATEIEPEDPRTRLAGERTLLAWMRTGLAMMGFGFVVARFGLFLRELAVTQGQEAPRHTGFSLVIGTLLVVLGVVVNLAAAWQHRQFLKRIEGHLPFVAPRWSLGVIMATILAVIGTAMAIYLVILHA